MSKIVEKITGRDDGYHYSDRLAVPRKTAKGAACAYARALNLTNEQVVVVHDGERRYGDVLRIDLTDQGFDAKPVVTDEAESIADDLVAIIHRIDELDSSEDAKSLKMLLESKIIDECYMGDLDDEHPASTNLRDVGLNGSDILLGVLLMLHSNWDLPHFDHESGIARYGGFSPTEVWEDA